MSDTARVSRFLAGYLLLAGATLVAIALVFDAARDGSAGVNIGFWIGVVALFAPVAWRSAASDTPATERLWLLAALALALYVVKVMHSPTAFTFYDELVTTRTAADILSQAALFTELPVAPAYADYPALELAALSVKETSGVSLFVSGVLIIGAAKVVAVVGLWVLAREITASERVASIAVLVYTANPNFVFFGSQFAYESFALPLGVCILALIARGTRSDEPSSKVRTVTVAAGAFLLLPVATGHHLSAIFFAALAVLWLACTAMPRRFAHNSPRRPVAILAVLAIIGVATWHLLFASNTDSYLGPVVGGAFEGLGDLLFSQGEAKVPFESVSAASVPFAERVVAVAGIALLLAALGVGLLTLFRSLPVHPLVLALAALTLAYPATLLLRLTQAGTETSNRASEFLFLGVSLVVALGLVALASRTGRPRAAARQLGLAVLLCVFFVSGIVIGWSPTARLPGPYRVVADSRSVDPLTEAAALWARDNLVPGGRLLADRSTALMFLTYGAQDPQTGEIDGYPLANVLTMPDLTAEHRRALRLDEIDYVAVDSRISQDRPGVGFYVDRDSEPQAYSYDEPIPAAALSKFEQAPWLRRIYDNGTVSLYETDFGG
jgi:hypothetical protein